ncbi:carbohydrate ABC transporter membrane protein 2, CUT1 family [Fontibacillus panacisegetis]|uniref:Carbohydrate ABC transporter membrane protein 2, CUT1 family n=1 Tax=Fontibacillus panacisegetis TaxID=670482 RepID=A0A1G7SBB5_9BACL|nr:carbohydrate ABC transporter permease [Fontibacillus panacisegetis]SDG20271.1 carbohydrate ABC transporter membrane protein 2, CUT1 family [Fontibacillus panacisegetis]
MGTKLTLKSSSMNYKKLLFSVIMLLVGILMIVPFIIMISSSFKTQAMVFESPFTTIIPETITWENYSSIFKDEYYFGWYFNSLRVVVLTIVLRGIFVTMAAYAFAKIEFRLKNVLFMVFISTMMITPDTTIVSRFLFYKNIGLTDSYWALVLPAAFDVYFIFMLRQFMMGIPKELSEAAVLDGCGHFRIYSKIIMPLIKPPLVTMVLFTFIWSWNDYANPYVFINTIKSQTLTVGLTTFQGLGGANYALQMAGATLAVIPTVVLFSFLQKYFVEGIASTGVKG